MLFGVLISFIFIADVVSLTYMFRFYTDEGDMIVVKLLSMILFL